ncbi:sushi, von Willebrand factor type A, EGF and pentraxin domain-containing protein 1-like [Scyliorhinus torazame]|uniref:sushi, von Willebrand factor type A, EGF and pentraxin domain-containing protein 1-like n=1 Tax=Scyliorhinus torazame TaxID=75743 RepID=UPI003B5C27E0
MAEKLLLALMATCTVWMVRVTGDCGKPPTLENGFLREQFIFHNSFHVGDKVSYGCYQGYVFKEGGSRSITCAEDSTWSPFRVECEPRNCGNPGEILNGYYKTTGTTLGNQVTFSCGVGNSDCLYLGSDQNGKVNQKWELDTIRCENLPSIPNGQVPTPLYGDHWEYGMIAKYSCIGDYSLVGADELTCTAIGKWNNDPPSCKAVRCHRTELIANGRIIAGFGPTYRYRETIIYACLEGYEMIGNNVIECGENNVFVPPPPTCKTRTCDDPPELEHGSPLERFLSKNSFDVGSRVIYRCEKGYILKQKRLKYVTCQHDLTWTRLQTICEPRHCGNPGEIWDGYFRAPDDSLGSKAVFYCNKGYGIVGRDHRICTPDGWDGQVPTCQSATCAALPLISKGRTPSPPNGDHWEHGMIAEFSCQNGYSLIGAETLACTVNGEWDKDPPTCKVVRCIRPEPIVNGRIIKGFGPTYRYQETITYSCNNGFEMDGNSVIECSENNIFVPPPPTCRPPIRCKDLPRTTYGRTPTPPDGGHWKQGMIATYACFFGYSLIGANILVCSETGMWDKDPPTCKVVNCGNPKEILNGYYKTTGRTIGRKAIFYCNKGYRIVGRNFQSCTMNGWFGQVQKCELIGCQSPDPLANGHIVRGFRLIYEHRETITYSCNEGYEMYGSNVIECSENHTFTPPPPTCRLPLNCGDPGEILNGCYKTAGYNVTFYCDIGYKMVGRDYLQCTAEGWDGEVPSCEPITCGNPGAIANGYYKAPNWTVGNNVTFYCDVG